MLTWTKNEWLTEVLYQLVQNPFFNVTEESNVFLKLEEFIARFYDIHSPIADINKLRKQMFCHRTQDQRRLPPTRDALLQHVKRAVLQGSIWTCAHISRMDVPSPADFGWTSSESGKWMPNWRTIDIIPRAVSQLVRCACKGDCTNCKCKRLGLECTSLCKCSMCRKERSSFSDLLFFLNSHSVTHMPCLFTRTSITSYGLLDCYYISRQLFWEMTSSEL
jgi:hypothetical protein